MENTKTYYALQQAGRSADIYIFGDITSFRLLESDVSAYGLVQEIKNLDADVINVHVDSYGGEVAEGWAIFNALKNHPAKVITYGDGFVASAALYPFMAGDERRASNLSAYYFHRVIVSAYGYADDLRAAADEADVLTEIGINAFTERTNLTAGQVKSLMENETWLTPEQALEYGIATSIVADGAAGLRMQSAKRGVMECVLHAWEGGGKAPPEIKEQQMNQRTEGTEQSAKAPRSIMETLAGIFNAEK